MEKTSHVRQDSVISGQLWGPQNLSQPIWIKLASWVEQVNHFADIANTQPHAAYMYAGFMFGVRHRWTFIQQTMPTAGDHMQSLKNAIDHKLLPTIMKHDLNDTKLELMRLPEWFGGMSFDDPVIDSGHKHADSIECTANLTQQIMESGDDPMKSIESDCRRKVTAATSRSFAKDEG